MQYTSLGEFPKNFQTIEHQNETIGEYIVTTRFLFFFFPKHFRIKIIIPGETAYNSITKIGQESAGQRFKCYFNSRRFLERRGF